MSAIGGKQYEVNGKPVWVVAWTLPKWEQKAKDGLARVGFQVFLPTEARWQRRRRRAGKDRIERPLFPGYLFVGLEGPSGVYHVAETDGVAGVLANDGLPLTVPESVMARMQAAQARGDHDATIGEAARFAASLPKLGAYVRMTSGIFSGLYAFVTAVRARAVQLTVAGSSVTVEMPAEQALEGLESA